MGLFQIKVGADLQSLFSGFPITGAQSLTAIVARLECQLWVASCWFEDSSLFLDLDWSWISFDLGLDDLTEEFFSNGIRTMFEGPQR